MVFDPVTPLTAILVFAMLFAAIRVVIFELGRRPPGTINPTHLNIACWAQWFPLAMLALWLHAVLFSPGVFFLSAVGLAVAIRAAVVSRSEERDALDDLVTLVMQHGGSLPDALERFAAGRNSSIARRSRQLAFYLRCGRRPEEALRTARLPLGIDAAILLCAGSGTADGPGGITGAQSANGSRRGETEESVLPGTWTLMPPSGRLAYLHILAGTVLLGLAIVIKPMKQIMEEFGLTPTTFSLFGLPGAAETATLLMYLYWLGTLLWIVMVGVAALTASPGLLRITPWFGHWYHTRNRSRGLIGLAGAVERGHPISEALAWSAHTAASPWLRSRSQWALRLLTAGRPLARSLRSAGWLNRSEAAFLEAAERTGHLGPALRQVAHNARRRVELLWELRTSILTPAVIMAAGVAVLWITYSMFEFLTIMVTILSLP